VLFAFDSAKLTLAGKAALDVVAPQVADKVSLKDIPIVLVLLVTTKHLVMLEQKQ
jgi:hypothetical protein